MVRQRGNPLHVIVYAGIDPLTGERMYVRGSNTYPAEAERMRTRFLRQVDDGRNAKTKAPLGTALDWWLATHEAEESTLDGYRGYIRRTIRPTLGKVPIGKVNVPVTEEFYAERHRCRALPRRRAGRRPPHDDGPRVQHGPPQA